MRYVIDPDEHLFYLFLLPKVINYQFAEYKMSLGICIWILINVFNEFGLLKIKSLENNVVVLSSAAK